MQRNRRAGRSSCCRAHKRGIHFAFFAGLFCHVYIRTRLGCLTPVCTARHLSLTRNTFVVQPPCLLFPLACLLKASLRRRSERGLLEGGFGEFCGNLNNYTPCSPRVINYICGKGFLILESSTDKGWWGERQGGWEGVGGGGGKRRRATKCEGALIKPFLTDSGCMQDLQSNIFLLSGQLASAARRR